MTAVRLSDLRPGDVVVGGLYACTDGYGRTVPAVGTVQSVQPARARGYKVVTFTGGRTTSGHRATVVQVAR